MDAHRPEGRGETLDSATGTTVGVGGGFVASLMVAAASAVGVTVEDAPAVGSAGACVDGEDVLAVVSVDELAADGG